MKVWSVIKCVIYGDMVFLGVLFNSFIILSSFAEKELKKIPFLFILNLTLINIFISVITMPAIIFNTALDIFKTNKNLCVGIGYVTMVFLDTSVWSMALGSCHFYICINHALHYKKYVTKQRVYIALFLIWVLAFVTFLPPLVGWGKIKPGDNLCLLDARNDKSYLLFVFIIGYFIPFSVTIFMNIRICIFLVRNRNKTFKNSGNADNLKNESYSYFKFFKDLFCFKKIKEEEEDFESIYF